MPKLPLSPLPSSLSFKGQETAAAAADPAYVCQKAEIGLAGGGREGLCYVRRPLCCCHLPPPPPRRRGGSEVQSLASFRCHSARPRVEGGGRMPCLLCRWPKRRGEGDKRDSQQVMWQNVASLPPSSRFHGPWGSEGGKRKRRRRRELFSAALCPREREEEGV